MPRVTTLRPSRIIIRRPIRSAIPDSAVAPTAIPNSAALSSTPSAAGCTAHSRLTAGALNAITSRSNPSIMFTRVATTMITICGVRIRDRAITSRGSSSTVMV